jgi:hypothetical protein
VSFSPGQVYKLSGATIRAVPLANSSISLAKLGTDISDQYITLNDWRLVPPAQVGHYENDCMVRTRHWMLSKMDPSLTAHHEDGFFTVYNSFHMSMRDEDAHNTGVPRYSFVYGPPVGSHRPVRHKALLT